MHSPALEGLLMEAFRSTWGRCVRVSFADSLSYASCNQAKRRDAMGYPAHHHKINYIEFSSTDLVRTKEFYSKVFGWQFQDYGPDYVAFTAASAGIDGGFYRADAHEAFPKTAPLVVL